MKEEQEPTVDAIMSSPVLTIDLGGSLAEAAVIMVKGNVGSVVVVDEDRPVGIVTERDILKMLGQGDLKRTGVKTTMSRPLIKVEPGTHCAEALETMVSHGIRRLPVVEGDHLMGIVTERDIMGWLLDNPDQFSSLLPEVDPHVVRDALVVAAQELRRRSRD